ncbi:tectonic-3-like, partial [Tachysurus ichikawai]
MPTRRVVVQLVVALGVILLSCSHAQEFTNQPPVDSTVYSFANGVNTTANFTTETNATDSPDIITQEFGPSASTEGPVVSRVQTPITQTTPGCTCNITPDFCDIGCCCDVIDCGIGNLSSVFNNCRQETRPGVCIESWLMFRANVDPQLVTDTGSLFCVRRANGNTHVLTLCLSTSPLLATTNPRREIVKIMKYLDLSLSDAIIDKIVKLTSFKVMKDNPMANYSFIPKEVFDRSISTFMRK